MDTITLTIDGKQVTTEAGRTVLQAARQAGIEIPTICAHDDLPDYGACRMCIVEIDNVRGYPTSCTTPATDGMVVRTQSPRLVELRSQILELMLSGHPNACLVCDDREACEKYRPRVTKAGRSTRCGFCSNRDGCMVRDMTLACDARDLNLPTLYCHYNLERDDPFMDRDLNLCILCGRCWRICEEIHGKPAISINNRGRWAKVGTAFGRSYVDSGCTFCGACIDICPTGTLTDRYARWYGQSDLGWVSACTLCPIGCSMKVMVKDDRVVSTRMLRFDHASRLCAIGRFAHTQLMNAPKRLRHVMIKENGELTPVGWEEAIAAIAEKLGGYRDGLFVAIVNESDTRENRHLYERLATEVLGGRVAFVPANGSLDDIPDAALRDEIASGRFKAALVAGDFLDEPALENIEYVLLADCLPTKTIEKADALLPVAILSEVEGTFRTAAGEIRDLGRAVAAPGDARPEWMIARDLAAAMGAADLAFDSAASITAALDGEEAPAPPAGSPLDTLREIPSRFRGHYIADFVPALEAMDLPTSPKEARAPVTEGFRIVEKTEVVPNFYLLTVEAPTVARHARPGQFIIVMVEETSERVPFTLVDWDAQAGTITLVVEEVGRSSGEIATLNEGDLIAHITGPLGLPLPVEKVGTVVLGGGCYGIGAIYPVARALKEAGNTVICVLEASSGFLMYMDEKMREVCDELIIATKDGSRGVKGGVQKIFVDLVKRGTAVNQFIAVGCTFMMRMVADETRSLGIPLQVALNPIMVDGTGMCGACRVSVAEETKFACVDGPFFDGHDVDWDELASRRGAYARVEIEALPQTACHVEKTTPLTVAAS